MQRAVLCAILFILRRLFKLSLPWLDCLKSIAVTMSKTAFDFVLLRFAAESHEILSLSKIEEKKGLFPILTSQLTVSVCVYYAHSDFVQD
jgi:hypothetical protein